MELIRLLLWGFLCRKTESDSGKACVIFVANKLIVELPLNTPLLFVLLHQCSMFCHQVTAVLVMVSLQVRVGPRFDLTSSHEIAR